jgi:hypothetical protein
VNRLHLALVSRMGLDLRTWAGPAWSQTLRTDSAALTRILQEAEVPADSLASVQRIWISHTDNLCLLCESEQAAHAYVARWRSLYQRQFGRRLFVCPPPEHFMAQKLQGKLSRIQEIARETQERQATIRMAAREAEDAQAQAKLRREARAVVRTVLSELTSAVTAMEEARQARVYTERQARLAEYGLQSDLESSLDGSAGSQHMDTSTVLESEESSTGSARMYEGSESSDDL